MNLAAMTRSLPASPLRFRGEKPVEPESSSVGEPARPKRRIVLVSKREVPQGELDLFKIPGKMTCYSYRRLDQKKHSVAYGVQYLRVSLKKMLRALRR